jgi:hypothetical protein
MENDPLKIWTGWPENVTPYESDMMFSVFSPLRDLSELPYVHTNDK